MAKRKQKVEEHVNKIKTICPKCEKMSDVVVVNYKTNKAKDGTLFSYKCLSCKQNFTTELKHF